MRMLESITRQRIVPVVVLEHESSAASLPETLLRAGMAVIEISFRTPAAVPAIRRIDES
jgi:2-dehydro-3-deoxyphosphogluconate aldolase / (4S)-4-hydroxy-2-oxoglutarate aldolase